MVALGVLVVAVLLYRLATGRWPWLWDSDDEAGS